MYVTITGKNLTATSIGNGSDIQKEIIMDLSVFIVTNPGMVAPFTNNTQANWTVDSGATNVEIAEQVTVVPSPTKLRVGMLSETNRLEPLLTAQLVSWQLTSVAENVCVVMAGITLHLENTVNCAFLGVIMSVERQADMSSADLIG